MAFDWAKFLRDTGTITAFVAAGAAGATAFLTNVGNIKDTLFPPYRPSSLSFRTLTVNGFGSVIDIQTNKTTYDLSLTAILDKSSDGSAKNCRARLFTGGLETTGGTLEVQNAEATSFDMPLEVKSVRLDYDIEVRSEDISLCEPITFQVGCDGVVTDAATFANAERGWPTFPGVCPGDDRPVLPPSVPVMDADPEFDASSSSHP